MSELPPRSAEREAISTEISAALSSARAYLNSYTHWDVPMIVTSIICGVVSTAIAGTAYVNQRVPDLVGSWPALCLIVALIGAVGTSLNLVHKALGIRDRVVAAKRCIGALQSLRTKAADLEPKTSRSRLADIYLMNSDCLASCGPKDIP